MKNFLFESEKIGPFTAGIDFLRSAIRILDGNHEGINQDYSAIELLKLVDAMLRSGWDITPDAWTPRQRREALRGIVPCFRDFEMGDKPGSACCDGYIPVYKPTSRRKSVQTVG